MLIKVLMALCQTCAEGWPRFWSLLKIVVLLLKLSYFTFCCVGLAFGNLQRGLNILFSNIGKIVWWWNWSLNKSCCYSSRCWVGCAFGYVFMYIIELQIVMLPNLSSDNRNSFQTYGRARTKSINPCIVPKWSIILFATCPKSMNVCAGRSLGAASVRSGSRVLGLPVLWVDKNALLKNPSRSCTAGSRVWGLPVDKDWRARIRNP